MSKPADRIAARDQQICELWIDGWTGEAIAERFGISPETVKVVRRKAGLKQADRKVRPKRAQLCERRPRSSLHSQLGYDIATHRRLKRDLDQGAFGEIMKMSRQRIIEIEAGVYDISLSQVEAFAKELGLSVDKLLKLRT